MMDDGAVRKESDLSPRPIVISASVQLRAKKGIAEKHVDVHAAGRVRGLRPRRRHAGRAVGGTDPIVAADPPH